MGFNSKSEAMLEFRARYHVEISYFRNFHQVSSEHLNRVAMAKN